MAMLFWYSIVELYMEMYDLFHKSLNLINIPYKRQVCAVETGGFQAVPALWSYCMYDFLKELGSFIKRHLC